MMKKTILILLLLYSGMLYASSQYDRDIIVTDQNRNEKVKKVFREMMDRYEEKDLDGFFSFVSEDRFLQDYMTFYEAIEKDMREYDTLSIDTWVDKISEDGVKRFLYVRWEKRYETVDTNQQIQKLGYSRFLFDEINGQYKLIELAGNNFWGESLPEWREEVPQIAGQEADEDSSTTIIVNTTSGNSSGGLPDLIIVNIDCIDNGSSADFTFNIQNIGTGATTTGSIDWEVNNGPDTGNGTYSGNLNAGETSSQISWTDVFYNCSSGSIEVDQNDLIQESNENNNIEYF